MNIFTVKDNQLVIHQEVVRNIPEFAAILRKRMPTPMDADGRDKLLNLKVFMYIFFVAEWRGINPLSALPNKERFVKAIEYAGLPATWKPDREVQAAIDRYVEIITKMAPGAKLLIAAKQGVSQAADQILVAVQQNEDILEQVRIASKAAFEAGLGDASFATNLAVVREMSKFLQDNIKDLRSTIKDLESMYKTIDKFEDLVAQQVTEQLDIFGGGILNPRELPPDQRKNASFGM